MTYTTAATPSRPINEASGPTSEPVWSWPAKAPWLERREALALALTVQPRAAHVRAFVDSIPSDDWPRWDEDQDLAMQDGLRLPPVLRPMVLVSPHNLIGRLGWHTGWDDPSAQDDLIAVLDRLVAEGEPVNRLVASHESHEPRDTVWRSPLQWAALSNRLVLTDRLLTLGGDPTASAWQTLPQDQGVRNLRMNALTCAASFGSLALVQRLLATGIPLDVPIQTVGEGDRARPVAYSALHGAVRRQNLSDSEPDLAESCAILTALVQAGMPLNLPVGGPMSALHQAVEDGHPRLLEHLLSLGADLDRPHYEGLSAWEEALALEKRWAGPRPPSVALTREASRVAAMMVVLRDHRVRTEQTVLRHTVDVDLAHQPPHGEPKGRFRRRL